MDNISGKTALVTGSSQGLGRNIGIELAKHGCHVLINSSSNYEKAQKVCDEIIAMGGEATAFICDITNEELLNEQISKFDIDILVNNARLDPYKRGENISNREWFNALIDVNLTGAYLCIEAVIEGMKKRRFGRILNISSVQAHIAMPQQLIPYTVSKVGMHALTRCYAKILGNYEITVNTLAPGLIVTENINSRLSPDVIEAKLQSFPLHRAATAEEIAQMAINTIMCGVMTGETVNINNGIYFPA